MDVPRLKEITGSVVTVFGSASPRPETAAYAEAYEVGKLLAVAGFTICNGGYGGTMEASARGAREAGGTTVGVITDFYAGKLANPWIGTVVRTPTAIDRLLELVRRGDAYVVLPGGTGTLLEMATIWEFMNKQIMPARPAVLLGDPWRNIVGAMRTQFLAEGRNDASRLVTVASSPGECADLIARGFEERKG